MAILVSNPSTVQFTGAPTEPQDPAATPLDAGFTEELANAMQPTGQDADGQNGAAKSPLPVADAKLNDLQILPPDVLLNAVGEANFAFAAQGQQAPAEVALLKDATTDLSDNLLSDTTESTQAAEMAAAALAAKMSGQTAVVQPATATAQVENSTDAVSAVQAGTPTASISVGTIDTSASAAVSVQANADKLGETNASTTVQSSSVTELPAARNFQADAALSSLTQNNQGSTGQPVEALPVVITNQAIEVVQTPSTVLNADAQSVIASAPSQLQTNSQPVLKPAVSSPVAQMSAEVLQAQVTPSNAQSTEIVTKVAQIQSEVDAKATSTEQTPAVPTAIDLQKSAFDIAQSDVAKPGAEGSANPEQVNTIAQTLDIQQTSQASLGVEGDAEAQDHNFNSTPGFVLSDSTSAPAFNNLSGTTIKDVSINASKETSFKFDAKLGAQTTAVQPFSKAQVTAPVSLGGAQSQPQVGQTVDPSNAVTPFAMAQTGSAPTTSKVQAFSANETRQVSLQNQLAISDDFDDAALEEVSEQLTTKQTEVISPTSAYAGSNVTKLAQNNQGHATDNDADAIQALVALSPNVQPTMPDDSSIPKVLSDDAQSSVKSFSDVSSTFVNTLVGGPQRPITTVMDWVALKPQEPPKPVMPHELRLDAGAVQVEIQRMVKQGGGHVVMELTPPDQSKFTIELKLDEKGGAYLKVEGISDSTKTRLEQSAPQLQEQFQQMGLNLQLDMRQNRDSSQTGASDWTSNEPKFDNNPNQEVTPQTTRAVAAERARKNNGGQVYLYA